MPTSFGKVQIPSCIPELIGVIQSYKHQFSTAPGSTNMAFHTIETADNVHRCVPSRAAPTTAFGRVVG